MQHLLLIEDEYKYIDVKETIYLDEDNSKHIVNVLRMKIGEKLQIANETNFIYYCSIKNINKKIVELLVEEKEEISTELKVDISLFQGVPKGDKLEYIIQKSTELGVKNIIPVNMQRSVAIIKSEKKEKKIKRFNEIALNACNQSKRQKRLVVSEPIDFKESLKLLKEYDYVFVAYENENTVQLSKYIKKLREDKKNIAIYVGPEGGFSPQEIELLNGANIIITSLGKRILRTETASLAMVSHIMLSMED